MITCYHVSEDCTSIRMVSGDHYVQDAAMTASSKMSDSTDASRARIVSNIGKYRALVGRLFPQPKIVAHNTYIIHCFWNFISRFSLPKFHIFQRKNLYKNQYSGHNTPPGQNQGPKSWDQYDGQGVYFYYQNITTF